MLTSKARGARARPPFAKRARRCTERTRGVRALRSPSIPASRVPLARRAHVQDLADAGIPNGAEHADKPDGCWIMTPVDYNAEYERFQGEMTMHSEFIVSKGRYRALWDPVLKSLGGRWRRHGGASGIDCFICAGIKGLELAAKRGPIIERPDKLAIAKAANQKHADANNSLRVRKGTLESQADRWWKQQLFNSSAESVFTLEYDVIGNQNYSVVFIPGDEGKKLSSLKQLTDTCLLFNIEGLGLMQARGTSLCVCTHPPMMPHVHRLQIHALPWLARKENFNLTSVMMVLNWCADCTLTLAAAIECC